MPYELEPMTPKRAILLGSLALQDAANAHGVGECCELDEAAKLLNRLAEALPEPEPLKLVQVRRYQHNGKVVYEVVG